MSATGLPNSRVDSRTAARVRLATGAEAFLDARRALFLPEQGVLAVADLHLGYAWVQRRRGALMPVSAPDSTGSRLHPLLVDYQPRQLVVLGDLVHQAVGIPALQEELRSLIQQLPSTTELVICLGNHDRDLKRLLDQLKLPIKLVSFLIAGRLRLHHGDDSELAVKSDNSSFALESGPVLDVIGHEHPALRLGDGVATAAKVPCFLVADTAVVLPAFSDWAAGCEIGSRSFLGQVARRARFHSAYACLGPRLLRMPLGSRQEKG